MGGLSALSKTKEFPRSLTALSDTTESRIRLGVSSAPISCVSGPLYIGAKDVGRWEGSRSLRRRSDRSPGFSTRRRFQGIVCCVTRGFIVHLQVPTSDSWHMRLVIGVDWIVVSKWRSTRVSNYLTSDIYFLRWW